MSLSCEAVFATVAHRPGAAWLDGGAARRGWSILAWDPSEVVTSGADWPRVGRRLVHGRAADPDLPFSGGVLGYVGYGAGHRVEPVPMSEPTPEPEVWLGRYDGALCYRHQDATWHPSGDPVFRAKAEQALADAVILPPPPPPPRCTPKTVARDQYESGVNRVLGWIRAGDCYQVNLTRPVFVQGAGQPWPAYRRLRKADAPYGAFLRLDHDTAILSNSPELFLDVKRRRIRSVPIKGTRPRGSDHTEDLALRAELAASDKDRAELTMIVDLVRNDLGRVAEVGSVRTTGRELTQHPNVHHAQWGVEARLRRGLDAWHALAAAFPPGSVTGAPKVRACQRIAELEAHPRGVYCGAIGFVADGGDATFNVAIRTAIFSGSDARYHVGGGIVAASDAAAEWDETVAKGRVLHQALVG